MISEFGSYWFLYQTQCSKRHIHCSSIVAFRSLCWSYWFLQQTTACGKGYIRYIHWLQCSSVLGHYVCGFGDTRTHHFTIEIISLVTTAREPGRIITMVSGVRKGGKEGGREWVHVWLLAWRASSGPNLPSYLPTYTYRPDKCNH